MRVVLFCIILSLMIVQYNTTFNTLPSSEPKITEEPVTIVKEPLLPAIDYNEIMCMSYNIYHEARNESIQGQIAVGNVTLNRVASNKFPNTVCDVVYQAKHSKWWKETHNKKVPERNKCQFSWYCDGKSDAIKEEKIFNEIVELSSDLLLGKYLDNTSGALWYHADYVKPDWANHYMKTKSIETHIFYVSYQ